MSHQPASRNESRLSTGVAGLDEVLLGGWPANHLYLVEGDPGAGKTTLALQFLMDGARRGESVLYVTLSESGKELEGVADSHHWPLQGITIFEYIPNEESLRPENEYSAFHPSEVEFHDAMQSILGKVEEVRPTRVVVDSLSEVRLLARDAVRYRRQILALKLFFLNRSCTVLMLDDRLAEDRDLHLQTIAHGVLILQRLPRDYGIERRRMRISKLRGTSFHEGFHDYNIVTGGLQVFPRLVAGECKPIQYDSAESGLPALDALIGGGIPRGTSTLLTGPAGCGKSSLAACYLFAAAERGEHGALFHFDEGMATALRRSAQLGMDLEPLIAAGAIETREFDPAEISPGQFTCFVKESVELRGARFVVIDSLNGFLNAMAGEQQLLLQMHELCSFLNRRGVVTLLILAQAGILGAHMAPPVDISYLADNVLVLRYFEAAGEVRKAVSVLKKRSGGHERTIRELRFQNGSIEVGEPLTEFHGVLTGVPNYAGSSSELQGAIDGNDRS